MADERQRTAGLTNKVMAATDSLLNSNFDEKEWIVQIEGMLGRDLEEAVKIPPSIFQLPDSITRGKPEYYVPTRVALGPYHHFRPDLYHMEIYKLDKAKTARITFELSDDFSLLINELKRRELKIRACFNKYIAVEGQTLALMMAIDGLYLLWLLEKATAMKENVDFTLGTKEMTELLKTEYATERDAILLENQIPVEVLNGILAGKEPNEERIFSLLFNYCSLISPFDLPSINSKMEIVLQSNHLLHLLYNLIMSLKTSDSIDEDECYVKQSVEFVLSSLGVLASILNIPFLQQLSDLASLLDLLKNGRKLFSSEEKPDPLVPSVSKLAKAGVKIEPTTFEGVKGTSFLKENERDPFTLMLPLITVNSFSEVILRNLVAFELTSIAGPPFLTRYIGLMSGLVETGEDVQLLVQKKIIQNDLGSDDAVVKLFSDIWSATVSHLDSSGDELGEEDELAISQANLWERGLLEVPRKEIKGQSEPLISKSIAGKKIRVMEDINQFYEGLWRVKTKKFLKKYIFSGLKIFLLVVLIAIVALVILRTICSFFGCPKILKSS